MAIDTTKIQPKALTGAAEQPKIPSIPGKAMEELVKNISSDLLELKKALELTPGITDSDKSKMQSLIKNYDELINENLGAAPGEEIKEDESKPKRLVQMPMEVGTADVLPSL